MYQMNMLKGSELPGNRWPPMLVAGIAFIIPVILAFGISIAYFNHKAALEIEKEKISDYEFQLRQIEDAAKRVDNVSSEVKKLSTTLSDVGEVLGRYTQWTDILLAIGDNMPDGLAVNKLDVIRRTVRRTVDQRYGKKKKINISIPARTLVISLYSKRGDGNDTAVRNLQRKLMETEAFGRCVEEVIIAVREPSIIDGRDVVRYELNCVLKISEF